MISILVSIVIVQTLVIFIIAVVVFGLVRQVGVLHERVAPMGALTNDHGPEIGETSPVMTINTLKGNPLIIGGARQDLKSQLLLFISSNCPVCKKLLPIAKSFAKGEKMTIVLIGDGPADEQAKMIEQHKLENMDYLNSAQVGMAFHVGKLPYAILIDKDGIIRAKGLVNNREHLESLVVAEETGYGSIQSYLDARKNISSNKIDDDNATVPTKKTVDINF